MQTWHDMAIDSLAAAKELHQSGRARSCVSRTYYAAYSAVTGELEQTGHEVGKWGRDNPGHEQIITMAFNNLSKRRYSERVRRSIARHLRDLFEARVAADYAPGARPDPEEALRGIQSASRVIQSLEAAR